MVEISAELNPLCEGNAVLQCNQVVPANMLKHGAKVMAVRGLDNGAGGGMYGGDDAMRLIYGLVGYAFRKVANTISLAGASQCKLIAPLRETGWPPDVFSQDPNSPLVLYNGMIAPLLTYAMRSVIWYQGASNVGRERQD